jgi:phage FluMu protein Com
MGSGSSTPAANLRKIRCGSCRNILALDLQNHSGDICVACPYCNEVSQVRMRDKTGESDTRRGNQRKPRNNQQPVVECTSCGRSLLVPPNTPRFRCPCGTINISPGERGGGDGDGGHKFVRCPRCSVVLCPPPGADRFRCICNIVLSAPNAKRWTCNLCERTSPASIQACVSCGNPRSGRPKMTGVQSSDLDQQAVANAFRLRRANQLNKNSWERRRDFESGEMRWFNDALIEVEGASTAESANSSGGRGGSGGSGGSGEDGKRSKSLKTSSSECAFVRQISSDGVLSWVPANEAKVASNVEGTHIDSHDLEGAASLSFDKKIDWFRDTISSMRTERSRGVVKISVRRDCLLEDIFQVFSNMELGDFKRSLFFEFSEEKGLDYGGVAREVFRLLFNNIFNVDFALFKLSSNNSYSINENSTNINEHSLGYFKFAGQVMAKAMFDGHVCQHHLSLPLFKHLLAW